MVEAAVGMNAKPETRRVNYVPHRRIIDEIVRNVEERLWRDAAAHYNGKGLELGADMLDIKAHIRALGRRKLYRKVSEGVTSRVLVTMLPRKPRWL